MKEKNSHIALMILACSAGGMTLLMELLSSLHPELSCAVLVVIHRNEKYHSSLEEMAQQKCALLVKQAEEKEEIREGIVYFAPAGYHLLVEQDRTLSLDVSEPVHYCRPSIDVTMQSAAEVYQDNLVAILLSGANEDGAAGLQSVHFYRGTTLVQHPLEAEVDRMPSAAIATQSVDYVYTNEELKSYCRNLR